MSALLMLDTDAVSALVKNRANTLSASLNDRPFCISVITKAELRFHGHPPVPNATGHCARS